MIASTAIYFVLLSLNFYNLYKILDGRGVSERGNMCLMKE